MTIDRRRRPKLKRTEDDDITSTSAQSIRPSHAIPVLSLDTHTQMPDSPAKNATDRRTAILAAVEARSKGGPVNQESTTPSVPGTWTPPSPEEDRKRKLEFGRIAARDIMGSNNYTSAATCIEVRSPSASSPFRRAESPPTSGDIRPRDRPC